MKHICLTQGKFALVDDEDFERVNMFHWHFNNRYAVRTVFTNMEKTAEYLHKFILNLLDNESRVDHKNRDPLDCQKHNLRICTQQQNCMNKSFHENKTCKGVYLTSSLRWIARVYYNKKNINLGTFDTKEEAMDAYDDAAIIYFGEFAATNKDLNKKV